MQLQFVRIASNIATAKRDRPLWGDNGMSGQIMMFSQRQHAMLTQPAENGQVQPFNVIAVVASPYTNKAYST